MRKTISVLGIGQIGLRVCVLFGKAGYNVLALDIDKEKIEKLNKGVSPIEAEDLKDTPDLVKRGKLTGSVEIEKKISESGIVIVCVPTPTTGDKRPDLRPLMTAAQHIGSGLRKNILIVVESTTYPGVVEKIIVPILEKNSGLKAGADFSVAYCSERIDLGNLKYNILNMPRILGAINEESLERAKKLYESALDAKVYTVSKIQNAELVKLIENTFRDVNIALVNEPAKLTDESEIDILEVIEAAATKPFAFIPHYPGPGVGGECIPVSPLWLLEFAREKGKDLKLVKLAREINAHMPKYIVEKLKARLEKSGKKLKGANVLILGLTYKENVRDTRLSPAKHVIQELRSEGAKVLACDPFLNDEQIKTEFGVDAISLKKLPELQVECILLLVCHKEFTDFPKRGIECLFFDTRNVFKKKDFANYMGLGR